MRVCGPRDSVGETRAGDGSNSVHAELGERRMGAARAQVSARFALEGAMGARAGAHRHRET